MFLNILFVTTFNYFCGSLSSIYWGKVSKIQKNCPKKVSPSPRTTPASARRYWGRSLGRTPSQVCQSPGSWRLEKTQLSRSRDVTLDLTNNVVTGVVPDHQELRRSVKVEMSGKSSVTVLDVEQRETACALVNSEHSDRVMSTISNIQKSSQIFVGICL